MGAKAAERLKLSKVSFRHGDARRAYSTGDIFYFYAPFGGKALDQVLDKLRKLSLKKPMHVVWTGPFQEQVDAQPWLKALSGKQSGLDLGSTVSVYRSRG